MKKISFLAAIVAILLTANTVTVNAQSKNFKIMYEKIKVYNQKIDSLENLLGLAQIKPIDSIQNTVLDEIGLEKNLKNIDKLSEDVCLMRLDLAKNSNSILEGIIVTLTETNVSSSVFVDETNYQIKKIIYQKFSQIFDEVIAYFQVSFVPDYKNNFSLKKDFNVKLKLTSKNNLQNLSFEEVVLSILFLDENFELDNEDNYYSIDPSTKDLYENFRKRMILLSTLDYYKKETFLLLKTKEMNL